MRWVLIVALAGACSRNGQEGLGLPVTRAAGVDVQKLATPDELVHALQLPGALLDSSLGARRMEARSSLKVEPTGRPVEKLDETYRLDADGKGAVHLVHDNSRDGVEAVIAGGEVYVKPRYGHWTKRKSEGEDAARLRDNVEGVPAAYLQLLARWLTVKEVGRSQVNGRPAVRLALSATASPSTAPPETLDYKKWRDTVKVRYLTGEWLLDAASGAPLSGKLEASYTFERSDLKGRTAVTMTYEQHGGTPEPIVPPADAVEPRRARPLLDRETLLDGLAPTRSNH